MKLIPHFLAFFLIASCSKNTPDPKEAMFGKWKLYGSSFGTGNGPEQRFNKASDLYTYQFNEDYSYAINDKVQATKFSLENDSRYGSIINLNENSVYYSYKIKNDTLSWFPLYKRTDGSFGLPCIEGCTYYYVRMK
ncbi:MAG: hypothetical protein ACRCVT_15295 [Leadbetterella sp.]